MNKKRNIFIGSIVLILIVCGTVYLYYHNKALSKHEAASATAPSQATSGIKSTTETINKDTINTMGNTNANIFNRGLAAQQGNWVYFSHKGLYKAKLDMKTGWQKICDGDPEYINVIGDNVYFTDSGTLYRVSTSGGNKVKLCEDDNVRHVIATQTEIFYSNSSDFKIYKINLSNNNKVQVTDDKCGAFSIEDGWIYYPKDVLNKIEVYKMKLDGSNKTKISNSSYGSGPVPNNNWLYYINSEEQKKVFRIKKDGSIVQKLIDEPVGLYFNILNNYIVYVDYETNMLKKVNMDNINDTFTLDLVKNDVFGYKNLFSIDNYILIYSDKKIHKLNANGIVEHITQ